MLIKKYLHISLEYSIFKLNLKHHQNHYKIWSLSYHKHYKNQKVDSDSTLKTAYQRGNDFNNKVAFSKQNVDAVVKRFQD